MFRVLVVLALLSCPYGLSRGQQQVHKEHGEKIVGGQKTNIEKIPFQVSLLIYHGQQAELCGGSILSDHWILTAAHCIQNVTYIKIRAGSSNLYSGGTTFITTNYTVHPEYDDYSHDHDAAVVYVPKRMILNNTTMKAVQLATSSTSTAAGTITTVSGWGLIKKNPQPSLKLRSAQVPIVSHSICSRIYRQFLIMISPNMLCAGYPEELRDSCEGDSGGPQVLETGEQVGIVSFARGCARPGRPGINVKVASLRSWIQEVTGV